MISDQNEPHTTKDAQSVTFIQAFDDILISRSFAEDNGDVILDCNQELIFFDHFIIGTEEKNQSRAEFFS